MKRIKKIIKNKLPFVLKWHTKNMMKKRLMKEFKLYYNNYIHSSDNFENIRYKIIIESHAIEKAMTNKNPRYFGIEKINKLIKYLNIYNEKGYKKDFSYNMGISILQQYCQFYEKHNWTNREEYFNAKEFLQNKTTSVETGVINIFKDHIIKDATIDYEKFLKCRHAIRVFDSKRVNSSIIKKAAKISQLTPTACNRQMVNIYYVNNKTKKNEILKYIHGLSNFEIDNLNYILITYDLSSLDGYEFTQGMFNSGLVSMNFINALHSMGIGGCFLEFNNEIEDELKIKKILNIPSYEKIAISIVVGYYPNVSVVPRSTRKSIDDFYYEIK